MANEQQKRNPHKRKAMMAVRNAVRRGKINKPATCSRCGRDTPRSQLSGHHHSGYEKRHSVKWVCPKCHSATDKKMQFGGYHKYRTGHGR